MLGLVRRLLCRWGFHHWEYDRERGNTDMSHSNTARIAAHRNQKSET
jgi:hypothetical protein